MPILSGAGILAGGVRALFSGEARARRQNRRETRRAEREVRQVERTMEKSPDVPGIPADIARGTPTPGAPPGAKMDIGEMVKKYWWVGVIFLVFFTPFGKKLMGNPRRAPRRRPKPKEVIRYRTRKAPAKRR